jgi:hypothetical protein
MLAVTRNDDAGYPAKKGNERTKENNGQQIDIVLRLEVGNASHRRVGSHHGFAAHNAEDDRKQSGGQADEPKQPTKSTYGLCDPVAVMVSQDSICPLVLGRERGWCRCGHNAAVYIKKIRCMDNCDSTIVNALTKCLDSPERHRCPLRSRERSTGSAPEAASSMSDIGLTA